jgi:2-keto-3-deoxy-L-rhamnonate aldolase RhmA
VVSLAGSTSNIIICPAIESLEGLENVEEIAAVEGIDMIAYGHSDLSAQLGVHLDLQHPTFKAAVRRIATACNAHGSGKSVIKNEPRARGED